LYVTNSVIFPSAHRLPLLLPGHQRKAPDKVNVDYNEFPFADWGKVFDSTTVATAIADRLVHNSGILILGATSYRRKTK